MSLAEKLTNKLYKWVVLYPGFRKFVNWAYSDLMKMPQYHINLSPGQVGNYVILVDDPKDTEKVAAFFDVSHEIAYHREYRTFTGQINSEKISVTSIGIGGPPAAIGVHELAAIGAETFIYLGNCFAPCKPAKQGSFIIPVGAVRDEGTGLQYAPLAFPAIADVHIADAFQNACLAKNEAYLAGLIRSTDTYYKISKDDAESFPHILGTDMNTAAIFITASVLKKKAGALLFAREQYGPLNEAHIKLGIDSLKIMVKVNQSDRSGLVDRSK